MKRSEFQQLIAHKKTEMNNYAEDNLRTAYRFGFEDGAKVSYDLLSESPQPATVETQSQKGEAEAGYDPTLVSKVIALARCSLANNPTEAVIHQIKRIQECFDAKSKSHVQFEQLLNPPCNDEMKGMKIVQSVGEAEAGKEEKYWQDIEVEPYAFWDGKNIIFCDPEDSKWNQGQPVFNVGFRQCKSMENVAQYARNMYLHSVKVNGNIFITNQQLSNVNQQLSDTQKKIAELEEKISEWNTHNQDMLTCYVEKEEENEKLQSALTQAEQEKEQWKKRYEDTLKQQQERNY